MRVHQYSYHLGLLSFRALSLYCSQNQGGSDLWLFYSVKYASKSYENDVQQPWDFLQMNQLLQAVRDVPGCHAVMFGSLPAGLSLPDSDIDVVLLQERPPFPPPPPAEGFTPQEKKVVVSQLNQARPPLFLLQPLVL